MVSLSTLQNKLGHVAHLAKTNGISFKTHHHGKVFILTLEPTAEKYRNPRSAKKVTKTGVKLSTSTCPACNNVRVGSTCLTVGCNGRKPL